MRHVYFLTLSSLVFLFGQAQAADAIQFSGHYQIPPQEYGYKGEKSDTLYVHQGNDSIFFTVAALMDRPSNIQPLWLTNVAVPRVNAYAFDLKGDWHRSNYCAFNRYGVSSKGYRYRVLIDERKITVQQIDDCLPHYGYDVTVISKDEKEGMAISYYYDVKEGDLDDQGSKTPDHAVNFPKKAPPASHRPQGWTRLQYVDETWLFGRKVEGRGCRAEDGRAYPVYDLASAPSLERRPIVYPETIRHLDPAKSYICQVTYTGIEDGGNAPGIHWTTLYGLQNCQEEVRNSCTSDFGR